MTPTTPTPSTDVLRVALIQEASGLEPAANRARIADLTPPDHDLVVFPEAFARDFGEPGEDVSPYAEPTTGAFAAELERVASEQRTTIVAGMFEASTDTSRPFNTLLVRGTASADYRKIHLYDSFGYRESDRLLSGEPVATVVEINGWQVGLMTCYDLRFPELARAVVDAGAEVLVLPAAWVAGPRKVDHWRTLATARAIENTAYVVAVGQPGPRYTGHSMVIDPLGDVVVEAGEDAEQLSATLERSRLDEARRTNPSLANRRL